MASVAKIARRSFLIGSAALVGGVAFGVYYVNQDAPNPLPSDARQTALNPYVLIDAKGITLITPRAEMGQGVQTTLAALVAEELDVAWEDITILHGPPAQAYYNTALMGAALPGADYAKSDLGHAIGEQLGKAGKILSAQITGGSTSMKDGYVKMRLAGASARETLKLAAARKLGLKADVLKTENGHVIAPDGSRLSYVSLAPLAQNLTPPQVALRDKSQWKYLGKSMPRPDIPAKSTGTATFGLDVRVEGMRFAALRQNPHLGGGMQGLDGAAALALPGVEQVVDLGDAYAVVARNSWLAMQALDAVEVTWLPSANPASAEAVFERIAAAFEGRPNSVMRDDGDADKLPEGATEIQAEYQLPYLAHATMEPMNATAHFTGDALTLWCGTQGPVLVRDKAAELAGLPSEAVTVNTTFLGGGFGRRIESDYAQYAVKLAVQVPGTPVQLMWSREEDMTHDFYRPGALARLRGGVKDGKAVLYDAKVAAQSTTQQAGYRMLGVPMAGPDKGHVEGGFDQPYAIPNYRYAGYLADLDIPVGFWRSVGSSFNGFIHDSFIDELAHTAGRDPLDFRLEMMRDEHAPSANTLRAVREMSGWTGKSPEGVGRGVAFTYSFGCPVAQVIEVVDEGGTIRIARGWIAADVGQALDPSIIEAQLTGGMIFGLSAAVHGQITFDAGAVEQQNFPDYNALRMHNAPRMEVKIFEENQHISGIGEPGTPPSMPALANALFDLTGRRARRLPLADQFNLLL